MKKTLLVIFILIFHLLTNAQVITTIAGINAMGYSGDNGAATTAELSGPADIAFDTTGNLYIADELNNCIRKINTSGIITTIAGNGMAGHSGDGGQATAAKLDNPVGVVFDAAGNLYVSESNNERIRKITTSGIITTIAGNGIVGSIGDGGLATNAELYGPFGIAVNPSGNLYIADYNNRRIRMVDTSGIITTVAGNGTYGFSGDGGQATNAELSTPVGIAVDALGNLYITDYNNQRIRKVDTAGIITTIAGNGTQGFSGDGGQATLAELNDPGGITLDANGNIYIADTDNNRIRVVDTAGIIKTLGGNGIQGFSGDSGQATLAELARPFGIVLDSYGNLYISDLYNNRVRKISFVSNSSIRPFANNRQVNIYPNPNSGNFTIEPNSSAKQTIQVFDVNGKVVLNQTINGKTNINASILPEGVYNISLINTEAVINKRFVIVK